MRKSKKIELSYEETERVISMAQEEKKPFEVIKEEFGITESEVTEIMRKKLSKDNFELWKKKVAAGKPKPKTFKPNALEDDIDDLDSKYYFKNKFD
ncbi:TIGR03643 family protein [Flavobacterium terrigena]|uniref:TIGR03643 family protein n=1 Tax=Flavobacterium terrigena TaxID=402734 RepID=A0A1H6S729_9FLAO|nr:TIGR03643 family protein [Flavobacterium terrigena]SEI59545.1 TIGR03643 family protein [Flavobacterium terrigena]